MQQVQPLEQSRLLGQQAGPARPRLWSGAGSSRSTLRQHGHARGPAACPLRFASWMLRKEPPLLSEGRSLLGEGRSLLGEGRSLLGEEPPIMVILRRL